jgi:hypothetical protein
MVQSLRDVSNYIVDIGASTGAIGDPAYDFITSPEYCGLCIEGNPANIKKLREKISNTFDTYCGFVTPDNILKILEQENVPIEIGLLKIDIDGYDLQLIRKILSKYRPKIIVAEINEKIPPPILFEVNYKPDYSWDFSHCFGFSLSSGQDVMEKNNYGIIGMHESNNIICADNQIIREKNWRSRTDMGELYQEGYISDPNRQAAFWYNQSVDYWISINDPTILLREITKYFTEVNERSVWPVKTKTRDVDFSIGIQL